MIVDAKVDKSVGKNISVGERLPAFCLSEITVDGNSCTLVEVNTNRVVAPSSSPRSVIRLVALIAGGVATPPMPNRLAETLIDTSFFVSRSAFGKSKASGFASMRDSFSHSPDFSAICSIPDQVRYIALSVIDSVTAFVAPPVAANRTPSGFFIVRTTKDIKQIAANIVFIVQVMR